MSSPTSEIPSPSFSLGLTQDGIPEGSGKDDDVDPPLAENVKATEDGQAQNPEGGGKNDAVDPSPAGDAKATEDGQAQNPETRKSKTSQVPTGCVQRLPLRPQGTCTTQRNINTTLMDVKHSPQLSSQMQQNCLSLISTTSFATTQV